MDRVPAKAQPQDPVAARLGEYISRAGVLVAVVIGLASFFRG